MLVLGRFFFFFNWNFGDCRFEYEKSVMVYLLCRLTYPEMASTTSAQTYNTREKDATTHSKDSDVQSRFSDSNDLADFDGEEIPAEVTDAISG